MPSPISQRCREHAHQVARDFEKPRPITSKERERFAAQSRRAMKMAAAAGITSIKQHTNPAALPS